MKMFLTRMGYGATHGDHRRPDADRPAAAASAAACATRSAWSRASAASALIEFSDADVVRHPLVAALIRAYDARDRTRSPRPARTAGRATRSRSRRHARYATRGTLDSLPMVVGSPDDLVAAVSRDRRMLGYRVRRQGDGWIELEVARAARAQSR